MTYQELAQFIKQERKKLHLTQQELADLSEVSKRTIQYIEAERQAYWDTLKKVVEALGYDIEIIISRTRK